MRCVRYHMCIAQARGIVQYLLVQLPSIFIPIQHNLWCIRHFVKVLLNSLISPSSIKSLSVTAPASIPDLISVLANQIQFSFSFDPHNPLPT